MSARALNALAGVIAAAMQQDRTPMGIALAIESAGMLQSPETAAELAQLRLLQNAQPAQLSQAQIDALADAGNRALNDHYHEDLCYCRDWPESCASDGYFNGMWDTAAFHIGMAAVIGAWESMRPPAGAAGDAHPSSSNEAVASESTRKLRRLLGHQPIEDPHDSPLHHTYTTARLRDDEQGADDGR